MQYLGLLSEVKSNRENLSLECPPTSITQDDAEYLQS